MTKADLIALLNRKVPNDSDEVQLEVNGHQFEIRGVTKRDDDEREPVYVVY